MTAKYQHWRTYIKSPPHTHPFVCYRMEWVLACMHTYMHTYIHPHPHPALWIEVDDHTHTQERRHALIKATEDIVQFGWGEL